ncbi:GntR family transcriptional regulator [Aneurinibacillus sp. REN35]|uniref:GntR family transcriptional regulator n=1 Tax=Aneurinibacillus sp. REN35 TaxID=3237286 RepID=UPI003528FD55
MPFSKIEQPQSFKQHAYEKIKNAIIDHQILPGEPLFERNLSESLGISRTPIREAIQLLELEGWVQSIPRKGTFVCNISRQDVEEVLQLRKANEALVMELLIPTITEEKMEDIDRIYGHQSVEKENNQRFISIDKDFHIYLAELSGNRRLAQYMQTLSDQMRWFGIQALNLPDRAEQTLHEHAVIIEGIKNRDVEQAKQAVIEHIDRTREAVLSVLHTIKEADR